MEAYGKAKKQNNLENKLHSLKTMGFIGNLIANIIGIIGGAILAIVVAIFSTLNIQIPQGFIDSINWIVGFFSYGNGIIPMSTLLLCGLWLLGVFILKYKINLFLHTLFPFIPIIGKRVDLPSVSDRAIAQHKQFEQVKKGRGIHTNAK